MFPQSGRPPSRSLVQPEDDGDNGDDDEEYNLPIHSKFCQVGRVERQSWISPVLGCEREGKITMKVKMVKVYMVKVNLVKLNLVVVIPDGSSSQR